MAFCLAFLAGTFSLLILQWDALYARRWLALASIAMLYPLIVLWRNLGANRRGSETELLSSLGVPNGLSALRGMLAAGMVGFLISPWPSGWLAWLPASFYILSNVTDFFDGYLARRNSQFTRLGEILDMSFDGLGVFIAGLLVVQYGQAPLWYLLVPLARYLFLAGIWFRRKQTRPVYPLPASLIRRTFASLQMVFLAALLIPLFSPPATQIAATLFAVPFLAGFLRDWLAVSGRLPSGQDLPIKLKRLAVDWLPLGLRLAAVLLIMSNLARSWGLFTDQAAWQSALALLQIVVIVGLLLGIAVRFSAGIGLFLLGLSQMASGLSFDQTALLAVLTALLFLGGGRVYLWAPEESWILRRADQPRQA